MNKDIENLQKYILENKNDLDPEMLKYVNEYLVFLIKNEEKLCAVLNEMENSKENISDLNKQIAELKDLRGFFDV